MHKLKRNGLGQYVSMESSQKSDVEWEKSKKHLKSYTCFYGYTYMCRKIFKFEEEEFIPNSY